MITLITLIVINILGYIIGYVATESKYRLVDYIPSLNFKPFNCRPCFTFWAITIPQCIYGLLILGSSFYVIIGILLALFTFFGVLYNDIKNIQ